MSKRVLYFVTFMAAASVLTACAHESCNNVPQRPVASVTASPSPAPDASQAPSMQAQPQGQAQAQTQEKKPVSPPAGKTVQVYKPTGQLQCGQAPGLPLDEVQRQLTTKKIVVYESHTQPDGRMHMALCGSPTGNIHVFTIPKKSLRKAERLGFKRWKPAH